MNAIVYKELSDASAILEIEAGKTLYENFEGLNLEDKIILVNGLKKYSDYIVKEGDLVVIRSIPRATYLVPFLIAVAIVGVVYVGVKLYEMRKQADELESLQKSLSDGVVNIPYLKGATNSLATGKSQPYVIGTHLFAPYLLSKGYSTIAGTDGSDQYYHVVLEGGFNNQVLRELNCDDVSLKDWGTSETTPQEGVYAFDAGSVFYDANSLIEVSQDGNAFATAAFNSKIVSQEPGSQLKKAGELDYEDLVFTLEDKTMSARVCIMFNGLRQFSEKGSKQSRTVEVIPEYKLNSGTDWVGFSFNQNGTASNTFTRNTNQQIRFEATVTFTYAQVKDLTEPVLIRLRCTTTKFDGSAYDDVYVQWVQSTIYDPDASAVANAFVAEKLIGDTERALSTLIGLKIKATTSNEDKLGRINAITSGVARVWDGDEWLATKVPTSNPAAWILEVLTSPSHNPSQMDDSEIDLDSLGELYEYCDTNELTVNMVITDGDTKQILLNRLAEICNSVLYRDIYGQLAAATDTVKANAIAILNTQNLISFENTKTMSRQTDGIRISYVNAAGGYVQDSYLVMRDGVTRTSDSIIRDISVSGITDYNQIVKYARRVLALETLRPKTITAKVGKEGLYFTPLAKILVQHPSLKIGLGSAEINAVIDNGTHITGVTLYEPIEYDSANANGYGAVIQCVSDTYSTPLSAAYTASDDGRVTEISFVTPIAIGAAAIPHTGDILSFGYLDSGEFNTITSPMTLIGADVDDQGYTLTLADYNEAIYTTGTIPTYTPNITSKPAVVALPPETPAATKDELGDAITIVVDGTAAEIPDDVSAVSATASMDSIRAIATWGGEGLSNAITGFLFSYTKNGTDWTEQTTTSNVFEYVFDRDIDGYPEWTAFSTWRFRVKAINAYGNVSALWGGTEAGVAVAVDGYLSWNPATPSVSTTENGRGPAIGWSESRTWYGKGSHDIQIAKGYTVVDGELVLLTDPVYFQPYAPAVGLNPKESYDNYQQGGIYGYLSRDGSTFALSLPLYGQNEADSLVFDTPYYIRVRSSTNVPTTADPTARDESDWSAWNLIYARASSAQDLVENAIKSGHVTDSAITANKIYVEMLAAISANLGVITDGAMTGSANNYWALSRIYDTDGITVLYYEGAMRVGGANQYLKVTPVVVGGVVTDYTIDFKVGTFTVTATGSTVNGDFIVKSFDGTSTWLTVDKTTGAVTITTPAITSDSTQVATTAFVKDVAQLNSHLTRAMQLNGDGVPIFPDNVAGILYQNTRNWTSGVESWAAGAGAPTVSIVDNMLSIANTSNAYSVASKLFSGLAGKQSRILCKANVDLVVSVHVFISSVYTQIATLSLKAGILLPIDYIFPATVATLATVYIGMNAVPIGARLSIKDIQIGSGAYDTPLYDHACCNRFTNNSVLPVKGTRGQALGFYGNGSLVGDNPVIGTSGTIAFWIRRRVIGTEQFTASNVTGTVSGISFSFNASNVLRFGINNGTAYGYGTTTLTDTASWHSIVITYNASALIFNVDGVDVETIASPQVPTIATAVLTIGTGLNADISPIHYDTAVWTLARKQRFANGDDVVDSQQKAITAVPHSIVTRDANGNIEGGNFVARGMGARAVATGDFAVAIGINTDATGDYTVANGYNADAAGYGSVALGSNAGAVGDYAVALGISADATGDFAVAIGDNAGAKGTSAVALGINTDAAGYGSVALGIDAVAAGYGSVALGRLANAEGYGSVANGYAANAEDDGSVAIGFNAVAPRKNEININNRIRYLEFASTTTQDTVYDALDALLNPIVGSHTASMGHFGYNIWVGIVKRESSSAISIYRPDSVFIYTFTSGSSTQIGQDFQVCMIQYANIT